jgi:hypothetical protein
MQAGSDKTAEQERQLAEESIMNPTVQVRHPEASHVMQFAGQLLLQHELFELLITQAPFVSVYSESHFVQLKALVHSMQFLEQAAQRPFVMIWKYPGAHV